MAKGESLEGLLVQFVEAGDIADLDADTLFDGRTRTAAPGGPVIPRNFPT